MKKKVVYKCRECGYKSPRWLGKCPNCEAWNSFEEALEEAGVQKRSASSCKSNSFVYKLDEISTENQFRFLTRIKELDRVLGGGIVPGSVVLVGGDPGIGKSTLMLQMCSSITEFDPLYVTGEESLQQIKYRAQRIERISGEINILAETNLEIIVNTIKNTQSRIVIIDSIQSIHSELIDATPGSIVQVRECANHLHQLAKKSNKAIFLIGHVNKDGAIAGPKILEHLVDTVIQFEGEKTYSYRILRALKNRYGSTNEIGIFEMAEKGLIEVNNPSEVFLTGRNENASGITIASVMEGSRPILLEVQALVTPTNYGMPQRVSNGFDNRRLQMILAVLEKRLGIPFSHNDVFVNIAGGVYLNDSSADLALAIALMSSYKDIPIDAKTVFIGEIGLTGEIRSVTAIEQRIIEADKLGFERIFVPSSSLNKILRKFNLKIIPVERIFNLISYLF